MPDEPSDKDPKELEGTDQTGVKPEGYMGGNLDVVKIKVNGEEKEIPLADALKMAEKAGGADAKFLEAAAERKKVEADREALKVEQENLGLGREIQTLYQKVVADGTATRQEFDRWCDIMKIPSEERDDLWEDDGSATETGKTGKRPVAASKISLDDVLDEESKRNLEYAGKMARQEQERNFHEKVLTEVDKSEDMIDILKRVPAENLEEFREDFYKRCRSEVVARLNGGATYGPKLLGDVIQEEAGRVKKYGTLFQRTQKPIGDFGLGSAGEVDIDKLIQDDKPLKRVAGSDENYGNNFAQRLLQRMLRK